jgi:hypothetical protein
MDSGGFDLPKSVRCSSDWRTFARSLVAPAVVAALCALLVLGLRGTPSPAYPAPDQGLSVASGTHFSGPVIVAGGIETGNNFTTTVGSFINSRGAVTVTDDLRVTGNVDAANAVGLRLKDDVLVTGTLGVSSQINAANGVNVTGNITVGTDLDVAGNIKSTSGDVRINDGALITGSLAVAGNVSDSSTMLRLNDDTLVTGTLGVSGDLTLSAGAALYGSGVLSVTNAAEFWTVALQPAATQVVSTNYGVTVTNYSVIYLYTSATDAGVVVNLDGTNAVTDGAYVGQLLVLVNVDTDPATITVHKGKNVQAPADVALKAQYDSATFMWNGTDWVLLCSAVTP